MKLQSLIFQVGVAALFCLIARADTAPHSFTAGSTISAAQVNANFVSAFSEITSLKAKQPIKFVVIPNSGTSPLTQTLEVPAGATGLVVEAIGGGGSGKCYTGATQSGGNGIHLKTFLSVTAGNTLTAIVGAGGAAAICSADGNDGSATILSVGGTTLLTAAGGEGGGSPAASPPSPPAGPTLILDSSSSASFSSASSNLIGAGTSFSSSSTGSTLAGGNGLMLLTFF